MAGTPEERLSAARLRAVLVIVEGDMPAGADRVDVLRRLGLAIAALEGPSARPAPDMGTGTCRRCGRAFTFDARRFEYYHLAAPKHCFECRQARRRERGGRPFPEKTS